MECIFDSRVLLVLTIRDVKGVYIVQLVLQPPVGLLPQKNEDWGLWVGNGCELINTGTGGSFILMPLGEIHLLPPVTQ